MAGITLSDAEAQLATWLAANTTLADGKSVAINGRSVTLDDCLRQIQFWDGQVQRLSAASSASNGRRRVQRIVSSAG